MKALKILELLNSNRIEELKTKLQSEIYEESLRGKPDAKKRYTAMKRYFTYTDSSRECLQKPCEVTFEDKPYISFTNSWSLCLTSESVGEIELFDRNEGTYP